MILYEELMNIKINYSEVFFKDTTAINWSGMMKQMMFSAL